MNLSPRCSITHSCALWLLLILTRCSWSRDTRGVARAGVRPGGHGTCPRSCRRHCSSGRRTATPQRLCSGVSPPTAAATVMQMQHALKLLLGALLDHPDIMFAVPGVPVRGCRRAEQRWSISGAG
uniref:Secreted protein n=1 Tax=Setaria viridis TaxID=4556 RepID=A0A4U6V777_SETVI|nr:hypothetical protein SEVIR_4G289200v2 [Setaria viridis]